MPEKSQEPHSSASLRAICDRIDAILITPRRVADEMEKLNPPIDVLMIDYQKSVEKSMKFLNLWGHGCEEALISELSRRGEFKARVDYKVKKSRPHKPADGD